MYKPLFPILLKLWALNHPPTYQYHHLDIDHAAGRAGFEDGTTTWIPKVGNIMTLGLELPAWLTPIRVGKFVYRKSGRPDNPGSPVA